MNQIKSIMKYLTSLTLGLVLSLGLTVTTNAVDVNSKTMDTLLSECTITEKSSKFFSAFTKEKEVSGPCDSIKDAM
ncbi:hypothetical protein BH23THE1_BH23THE1_30680 [soil metagenome]